MHHLLQVEVWMQTFAPNSGTPIHRHACEEVFITLKGYGTLYLSRNNDPDIPGKPEELPIYPNATFTIPVDAVHQVTPLVLSFIRDYGRGSLTKITDDYRSIQNIEGFNHNSGMFELTKDLCAN